MQTPFQQMLQLKTKRDGPQGFGVLASPSSEGIRNDESLYAAVHAAGGATVWPFEGSTWMLTAESEILSPAEFEQRWQGD